MAIVYKNFLKTTISETISATSTHVKVDDYSTWIAGMSAGDFFYALAVSDTNTREIFRVNFTGSSTTLGLAIDRGIDGTTAQAWGAGTTIWQDVTAAMLDDILQKAVFRQGAFIPDATLSANYTGEKFYQTDLQLWWKAVEENTSDWRLIAGVILTEAPYYTPAAGTYFNGTTIVIDSNTTGATIYYTTDGTDPDSGDTEYTAPVSLPDDTTTTLKSIAYGPERYYSPSTITSGDFTMQDEGTQWTVVASIFTDNMLSMVVWNGELWIGSTLGKTYKYNDTGGSIDLQNDYTGYPNKHLYLDNSNNLHALSDSSTNYMVTWNGTGSEWTNGGSTGCINTPSLNPAAVAWSGNNYYAYYACNTNLRYWDYTLNGYTTGPLIAASTYANAIVIVTNDGTGSDRIYLGCTDGNARRLNVAQNDWDLNSSSGGTSFKDAAYDATNNRVVFTSANGRIYWLSGTWSSSDLYSARSNAQAIVIFNEKFYYGHNGYGDLLRVDPSVGSSVTKVADTLGYNFNQLIVFDGTIFALTSNRLLKWTA